MSERYQVQKQIGQGGLGVVYQAFDTQLGREVAIKRVLVESGETADELTEDLIQEAKTLSALNHPNIVTVHDVGVDSEGPFVVMELLSGETLDTIVERGTLPVADFEEFAVQSLEGLIAAQSVDLLHRDLKPPNIMIVGLPSGKFQVKILDFGLAKFSRKPSVQTMDHGDSIFGSIYFMAPEQFEQHPLDARTDLYSLGCCFYYALTGKHPFQGDSAVQVMLAHMEHRMVPLKMNRPDVPEKICNWIESLVARNMDDRPADAKAALELWNAYSAIDEKQAREAACDDAVVARELLDDFIAETDELLDQLNRELAAGQGSAVMETAQTIRGTASTLGYTDIISIALEIERIAQTNPDMVLHLAGQIPVGISRVEGAINRMKWNEQS